MPGSANSLGSLSSPSPSLSPPPAESSKQPEAASNGLGTDSELSELTEEEQETEKQKSKQIKAQRGSGHSHPRVRRPTTHQPRRGRKKRGGTLVPPAMWGWVPKAVEEEEEEELAGPPRAMEEEEDDEDASGAGRSSGHSRSAHPARQDDDDDEGEPEIDVVPRDANDPESVEGDNDATESGDEEPVYPKSQRSRLIRRPTARKQDPDDSDSSAYSASGATPREPENDDSDSASEHHVKPDEIESEDETEPEGPKESPLDAVNAKSPAGDAKKPVVAIPAVDDSMDIDATAPPVHSVAPLVAAAAASSIMAGSAVVDAASPASSASSAANSPASSRSPSPAPLPPQSPPDEAQENDSRTTKDSKSLQNGTKEPDEGTPPPKHVPPPLDLANNTAEAVEQDGEPDLEPDPDPDRSAEDIDVDEASPDNDLEAELEADLQPAHRAEALDVLATIELKFALLRERLYVEKMESLAWEESLVMDGNHPELIHLHAELSSRRDKRIELATRKRQFEVTSVTKRRKLDEHATWSWWKFTRDALQTDMISETNRRRRKLERDRKALERPQPIRRMPQPIQDLPPAPTLRQIAKSFPQPHRQEAKLNTVVGNPLFYPEVTSLSTDEVHSDIGLIYQHRRATHGFGMAMNAAYEQVPEGFGIPSPFSRMPPMPPSQTQQGFSEGRAIPPHPINNHHHHHPQSFNTDQETGPSSQHGLHPAYFGPAQSNGVYGGQNSRRSISPVNLAPNGGNPKQNGSWPGIHPAAAGPMKGGEWGNDMGRRDPAYMEDDDRIRTGRRDRDKRDRERDQELDRSKDHFLAHPQASQSRHPGAPPPPPPQPVQHAHPHPHQSHHHNGPHHHHHHHHHIVHHHHNPSNPPSILSNGPALSPNHIPTRDFDTGRPQSGPILPTEVINLSSTQPTPSHWKNDDSYADYRDGRLKTSGRAIPSPQIIDERERDRQLATPFVLSSSAVQQQQTHTSHTPNNGMRSPRGSWASEDPGLRLPPPSTSTNAHGYPDNSPRSPGSSRHPAGPSQPNRGVPASQSSLGLSPPRTRSIPESPSLTSNHASSLQSPPRFGAPPSGLSPSLKMLRPGSPPSLPSSSKIHSSASGGANAAPSGSSTYSPRLVGPGRTTTPTGVEPRHGSAPSNVNVYNSSRTASSLTSGLPYHSPSMQVSMPTPLPSRSSGGNINGILGDRDRERDWERERERERRLPSPRSPMLAPTKMQVAQIVDGH
ncbi:hypothetical protein CCMSSC00406_0003410 [Pleurotus cornucopiae]|uniref:Uncharacterized protein n=1 Tax=Pleurotus cornucopiae TaxID=5321 RepID=A0ACB7J8L8_PLECO|nr:hypothetical protein CCMSSC00406_0003410 [Pleurotus cornucopiae]